MKMEWMTRWVSLGLGLVLLCGCARYEYELTEPADLAGHIGKMAHEVKIEPVVYVMQSYENHLVMKIRNDSAEPVMILPERSVIVTPDKQSLPIRGQTIAPGSYVKLVLPPVRTNIQPTGPAITIGFGAQVDGTGGIGSEPPVDGRTASEGLDRAVYLVELDEDRPWDWDGQTDVRLLIGYRVGQKDFEHRLVIHRVKM